MSLSFPHLTFYLYFSFFHPSSPLCIFSLILLCGLFSLNSSYPVVSPANACPVSAFFFVKQEVLPDRKRVTTRSYLPITPVDTDSGSNFTCVASNPAVPMGKRTTLTLNVHRMLLFLSARLLNTHRCSGDEAESIFCRQTAKSVNIFNYLCQHSPTWSNYQQKIIYMSVMFNTFSNLDVFQIDLAWFVLF